MKCPKCNVEVSIAKSYYEADGDNSADTATRIFLVQEFKCRNKKCSAYDTIVATDRTQVNKA